MDHVHRAKIFSAFDALAGFDDCIASKEVLYTDRRRLSEEERQNLNRKLSVLQSLTYNSNAARRNQPLITVEYFSPCTDENSFAYGTGGIYKTLTGICRKVDEISGTITVDKDVIALDDISAITGSLFDSEANYSLQAFDEVYIP